MTTKGYDQLQSNTSASMVMDEKTKEILEAVDKRVKAYDPEAGEEDENIEFHEKETVTFTELITRFASGGDYILLLCGCFWSTGFGAAMPGFCLVFGELIDDMGAMETSVGGESNPMKTNTLFMLYVAAGAFVTSAIYISTFAVYSERVALKLRLTYFEKALSKDAAFYDEQNPNEMASKINKEAQAIRKGTSEKMGNVTMTFACFAMGFLVAFYFGWKLSLILLGALPFILCSGVAFGASLQSGMVEQMKAYAQSAGYAEQALQSVRVVHTYGNEILEYNNYSKYLDRARIQQRKSSRYVACSYALLFGLIYAFYACALYFGGLLRWEEIREGDRLYTGGRIITIMFAIVFGAMQLGAAGPAITAMQQARVAMRLSLNCIDQIPIVNPENRGVVIPREAIKGQIEFKNVNFTYPTRKDVQVLKNFTCSFDAGKTTALVGPSGSGKSTIIQMIERFYQNDSGTITVDGQPIQNLDLRSFRRLMGYVGQEPVLFNATIRENMRFAKPDATDNEIRDALNAANAWTFIQKIETGLDTIVGGSGGSLSGGQKQRVAIARAFLKKPRILLLDEATSALDKVNEKIVQDAVDNYRKKNPITIIVIAHRLTTIRDADKIVVLVNGELKEMGNHDHLMKNFPNGVYADFCQRQASSEAQQPTSEERLKEDEIQPEVPAQTGGGLKRTKTITDKQGRTATITIDATISKKLDEADQKDEAYKQKVEDQMKPLRARSDFKKVMAFNSPKIMIFIAVICVTIAGLNQPAFGWVFAEIMTTLTIPIEYIKLDLKLKGQDESLWSKKLEDDVVLLVIYIVIIAGLTFLGYVGKSYCFSYLGENVTLKIRQLLYHAILEKNIGWFDFQENQSSVLTSAMAQESAIINGASSEALGPYCEAFFALFGGLVLGFIFCWQMSLITLGVVPFIVISNYITMEFEKGLTGAVGDAEKQANLLIGDAVNNFKTVQSFGYEELIVKKYHSLIYPIYAASRNKHIKGGFSYGLSQFIVFAVFALLFYTGGMVVEANCESKVINVNGLDVVSMECSVEPKEIFIALFAIFFGANQAGMAMSMGPDIGKAQAAATKIFKIIEEPSSINAIAMDKDSSKKRLDPKTVKGKIEFKDVWFRYPTRKDDFVLKGLTLTINPNESVALVGESGCGKSTFVNLMMRFYDPDFGTVYLDGVDIKQYNLHDLRKAMSLVMQEPNIFNYSIKENILYGKIDAKNSEILHASTIANCNEFIEKGQLDQIDDTPNGLLQEMVTHQKAITEQIGQAKYIEDMDILTKLRDNDIKKGMFQAAEGDVDTRQKRNVANWNDAQLNKGFEIQCGLKGGKLSGGQKQRVAIARTLISQPKVLLLDEATSALDETSQKKVQQAIESAMQGRTTIIIAHRMSTIEKCSKIFVLEEGRVKEEGNFNSLKQGGGLFSKLAQAKQE